MSAALFVLLCALSMVVAYPNPRMENQQQELSPLDITMPYKENYALEQAEVQRVKRQLNIQGGGSPGKGLDLSVRARVPVWQSGSGRHSFDATGQYAQHLGGRYGNSPPNWGVGGVYTFRF